MNSEHLEFYFVVTNIANGNEKRQFCAQSAEQECYPLTLFAGCGACQTISKLNLPFSAFNGFSNRVIAERKTGPRMMSGTPAHVYNQFVCLCARAVAPVAYRIPFWDRASAAITPNNRQEPCCTPAACNVGQVQKAGTASTKKTAEFIWAVLLHLRVQSVAFSSSEPLSVV